jgi:hypothetical protein
MTPSSLTQDASAIARAECRSLCNTVTATLPREIRDLIYASLLDDYDPLCISNMVYDETKHTLLPSPSVNLNTLLKQHWVQAEQTGSQFLQELFETLYDTTSLQLRNTPHRATSFFLNGDPFCVASPYPASQHLRRIVVVVESFFFRSNTSVPPFHAIAPQDVSSPYKTWVVECFRVLDRTVSKKCKIIVQVTEMWKCLTKLLLFMGPRLRIMKDAGFVVEVWEGERVVEWEKFV